jgi:radical SAM superfamily enzyme YgiQ (UPF0313 family)
MEKILVLEPLLNRFRNRLFFKSKEPNLSILRGLTVLKQKYKTKFIDFKTDSPTKSQIISEIKKNDYIFLNIKSYNLEISAKIINLAKKYNNKIRIYVFGQLPEARPDIFLKRFSGIAVIKEEFYDFTQFFVNKNKINKTKNLDNIPKIDLSEMKKRDYFTLYPMKKLRYNKWAFMYLSEGCAHNCIFCSQTLRISHGKKINTFSTKESISRIKRVLKSGFNTIRFADDDFLGNVIFVKKLCNEIIKQKIKFRWMAQVRADKLNNDIIKLMKKAGCECVNFGIESGSKRILSILKKGESLEKMKDATKLCKNHKIKIVTYFMIGNPSETQKEINQSIKLSFLINPDVLQVGYFTPYEGSPFYEENRNLIESKIKYGLFHYDPININFSNVDSNKLKLIYKRWNLKYYFTHPIKSLVLLLNLFAFYPKRTLKIIKEILWWIY